MTRESDGRPVRKIECLDAGRGLACLLIVLVHAHSYDPIWEWIELGRFGVHFFFVLSGYVIYHVHSSGPFNVVRYAISRIRRVYPPYLPVGIFAAIAYLALGRDVDWLASLTLLPGEPALIPAWTLQHEVAFYALAALFFLSRAPLACAAAWALAIVATIGLERPLGPWESVLLGPVNLCFVGGMVLARLRAAPEMRIPRPLTFLGEASYAIYLMHLPIMGGLWRLGFGFSALLLSGVTAGIAYHLWVERPLLEAMRSTQNGLRPGLV